MKQLPECPWPGRLSKSEVAEYRRTLERKTAGWADNPTLVFPASKAKAGWWTAERFFR